MEELTKPILKEPILIKSIVNGLIATSIIWVFWTPFLIFMGAPLMNALIKNQLCYSSENVPHYIYNYQGPEAYEIYEKNLPDPPTVAKNIIKNNKKEFISENLNMFILFTITSLFVIFVSLYTASYLINAYNLNKTNIIIFNLVMAIIIVLIETVFFATITTQYNPINMSEVVTKVSQKLKDEYGSLTKE